ncbi:MAG: DtxR family transcriptional regulator [Bacillota bacterium]
MKEEILLSKSLEDYLEVIFHLSNKNGSARITDIASNMEVAASSVNEMIGKLSVKGLVKQKKYGPVLLTENGAVYAKKIDCIHKIIFEFLHELLGVEKKTADHDACLIEHNVSYQTVKKLNQYLIKQNIINEDNNCLSDFFVNNNEGVKNMGADTKNLNLNQLDIAAEAEIIKINAKGKLKRKLMDMGITRGTKLTVKGKAPMGDPIEVKIRGYSLSLRQDEAAEILVKEV